MSLRGEEWACPFPDTVEVIARIRSSEARSAASIWSGRRTELYQSNHFEYRGKMETKHAVLALSALAHEGRLNAFRLLVRAGPLGLAAGEIARRLEIAANTLSGSLSILTNAGLVENRREGKSVIYSVRYENMTELLGFLIEDCCAGSFEICAPLTDLMAKSCCEEPV